MFNIDELFQEAAKIDLIEEVEKSKIDFSKNTKRTEKLEARMAEEKLVIPTLNEYKPSSWNIIGQAIDEFADNAVTRFNIRRKLSDEDVNRGLSAFKGIIKFLSDYSTEQVESLSEKDSKDQITYEHLFNAYFGKVTEAIDYALNPTYSNKKTSVGLLKELSDNCQLYMNGSSLKPENTYFAVKQKWQAMAIDWEVLHEASEKLVKLSEEIWKTTNGNEKDMEFIDDDPIPEDQLNRSIGQYLGAKHQSVTPKHPLRFEVTQETVDRLNFIPPKYRND